MKLHVVTAVTRFANLPLVAASLADWGDADYCWHLRLDPGRRHVGGQAVKNLILDDIAEGWVWFLDDDTVAHRRLYREFSNTVNGGGAPDAIIVSQRRTDRTVLQAASENVKISSIDIGQAILSRALIGNRRIPETYAGDGEFLEEVLDGADVRYVPKVLSFHNALGEK